MKINKYVLMDKDGTERCGWYDSYAEAERAAGDECAVIEYQFQYTDSELVYTPDGGNIWPPAPDIED